MTEDSIDRDYIADIFLVDIINGVEEKRYDQPVNLTLIVGGFLVTGEVVSYRDWLAGAADNEGNPHIEENVSDNILNESERIKEDVPKEEEKKAEIKDRRYIHMRKARVYHGTLQIPTEQEGFDWRFKLSAVDGWAEESLILTTLERKPQTIKVNGQVIEIS